MDAFTPSQVIRQKKKNFLSRKSWITLAASLLGTLITTLILFGVIFGPAVIEGDSMNLSLKNADFVLYWRLGTYGAGDVVMLKMKEEETRAEKDYVKRIVGTPGDTVTIDDYGNVLINGVTQPEKYAVGNTQKLGGVTYPLILQSDEYFVLGDNRQDSRDSRTYGAVKKGQIKGKVVTLLRYDKDEI